jgi:rubrerythrin
MSRIRLSVMLVLVLSLILSTGLFAQETAPAKPAPMSASDSLRLQVSNELMTTYSLEMNAKARYDAYAKQAKADSMPPIAKLFRAAAFSKQAIATELASTLDKMKLTAKVLSDTVEVKSTKDNLKAALVLEQTLRDTTVARYYGHARTQGNKTAELDYGFAKSESSSLIRFIFDARRAFARWKTGNREFFGCAQCGNIVAKADFKTCPVCGVDVIKYQKIN